MRVGKASAVLAVAAALVALEAGYAAAFESLFESERDNGRNSGRERGGFVQPCSLVGVNPAAHPEIFGSPALAKTYGFVRSRDGIWRVQSNCLRGRSRLN
jgi:hypothetical protein